MSPGAVAAPRRGGLVAEGRTKRWYETDRLETLLVEFNDPAAAQISTKLFQVLESKGVPTHFEQSAGERALLVKRLAMIPLIVTVRNRMAGPMARALGLEPGTALAAPTYELHRKSSALGNPLVNEHHALALRWATEDELRAIRERSVSAALVLTKFFQEREFELVDVSFEFGRFKGKVLLGDELSPETMRLWPQGTKPQDPDLFSPESQGAAALVRQIASRVTGT